MRTVEKFTPATAGGLQHCNWPTMTRDVDAHGWAIVEHLLTPVECRSVAALYDQDAAFRSRVVMARHGFGNGEYRYFSYPLPALLEELRPALYAGLVPLANSWNERMGVDTRYPQHFADFQERCRAAGQGRPTPLLLKYTKGDFNCLHQDIYGEHVFPLQVAVLLSVPGDDFTGGEFILTEQKPRQQSRATVAPLGQGDAVVFAVRHRPVRGTKGFYRVNQRHGVSTVLSGWRYTLGIIFHDASGTT
jgi:hypothetical protein